MDLFSRPFLAAAAERAVKTFAQTLAGVFGASQAGLLGVDWRSALSVAGLAALASILTSVISTTPAVPPVVQTTPVAVAIADIPPAPEPPPVEGEPERI